MDGKTRGYGAGLESRRLPVTGRLVVTLLLLGQLLSRPSDAEPPRAADAAVTRPSGAGAINWSRFFSEELNLPSLQEPIEPPRSPGPGLTAPEPSPPEPSTSLDRAVSPGPASSESSTKPAQDPVASPVRPEGAKPARLATGGPVGRTVEPGGAPVPQGARARPPVGAGSRTSQSSPAKSAASSRRADPPVRRKGDRAKKRRRRASSNRDRSGRASPVRGRSAEAGQRRRFVMHDAFLNGGLASFWFAALLLFHLLLRSVLGRA